MLIVRGITTILNQGPQAGNSGPRRGMSLTKVKLTWEALLACTAHALSTEQQEIMGILIGSWQLVTPGQQETEALVRHVVMMQRTDRRRDRVEVDITQLAEAAELASKLSQQSGVEMNVIGWYHSHPHITVLPSHVDLRTQAQYQVLNDGFIGLIIAAFQTDRTTKIGRIEMSAFQSIPESQHTSSLYETDSSVVTGEHQHSTGGSLMRKDVPIEVLPEVPGKPSNNLSLPEALSRLAGLQEVLLEEERAMYLGTVSGLAVRGQESVDACYDSAVYVKALSCLAQHSATPLLSTCEAMLESMRRRKCKLRSQVAKLESEIGLRGSP